MQRGLPFVLIDATVVRLVLVPVEGSSLVTMNATRCGAAQRRTVATRL